MQNEYPKVSILITIYNQIDKIKRALDSAKMQDYPHIEIIIGDDASDDGDVYSIIESNIAENIKYVRQYVNLGRRDNYRSLLFDHATGDYATILNADDFYTSQTYISKVVSLLEKDPAIKMVFGKTGIFIESTGGIFVDSALDAIPNIMDGNTLLLNQTKGHIIPHITSIYDRQLALDLDFYRADCISEDWESLLRLIQGHKVGYIKELSGLYGRHSQNVSKTIEPHLLVQNTLYIESPFELAKQLGTIPIKELTRWRSEMLVRYFTKSYIKIQLWDPIKLPTFMAILKEKYPEIENALKKDIKIKIFDLIKGSSKLLYFVFKYYLKQEAVISDFLQYRKIKNR